MKRILTVAGALLTYKGVGILSLGALYEIQSWEMPVVAGTRVELVVAGVLVILFGIGLLLLRKRF